MTLHELCLSSLNHEITQALACSKRLEKSAFSNTLAGLGLLHFFVVSGAHLTLILNFSNSFKESKLNLYLKNLALLTFVGMCNGSPPILRVFISYALATSSKAVHTFIPGIISNFASYIMCLLLFSSSKFLIFSTNLSFAFWIMVFLSRTPHILLTTFRLYILSIPFLAFIFGVPHYITIAITPVTATVVGFLLLPASLMAVFSSRFETLAIESWWFFNDFINFINIFFNYPKKFQLEFGFISSKNFIIFNILNFITIYIGIILWRRRSYSFV
jgi:hypothetical protein